VAVVLLTSYSHLSEPTALLELAPHNLRYRLPGIIGPVPPPLLIREIQYLVVRIMVTIKQICGCVNIQ